MFVVIVSPLLDTHGREKVDVKTEAAWLGHPRHVVFDNSTDFETKLSRVTAAAARLAGLPCRPRKLCKFVLYEPPPPLEEFPVPAREFHAEKVSLGEDFYGRFCVCVVLLGFAPDGGVGRLIVRHGKKKH